MSGASDLGLRLHDPPPQMAARGLLRLVLLQACSMHAFHLSFQDYFVVQAVTKGRVELPGFAWNAYSSSWEKHHCLLQRWLASHRGCYPRRDQANAAEDRLALWIHNQRTAKAQGVLHAMRVQRLEGLLDYHQEF